MYVCFFIFNMTKIHLILNLNSSKSKQLYRLVLSNCLSPEGTKRHYYKALYWLLGQIILQSLNNLILLLATIILEETKLSFYLRRVRVDYWAVLIIFEKKKKYNKSLLEYYFVITSPSLVVGSEKRDCWRC